MTLNNVTTQAELTHGSGNTEPAHLFARFASENDSKGFRKAGVQRTENVRWDAGG